MGQTTRGGLSLGDGLDVGGVREWPVPVMQWPGCMKLSGIRFELVASKPQSSAGP